jgi:isopropylmalate/homocitrate/citramalate synthase
MDLSVMTEMAEYFEKVIGYQIPPRTPFMGRDFNVTRAGIHADGLLKDEEIYSIFDTQKVLSRPAGALVDALSGLPGVAYWMNQHFKLTGEKAITKADPIVAAVKKMVDAQYAEGRTTTMSDEELEAMCRAAAPQLFETGK